MRLVTSFCQARELRSLLEAVNSAAVAARASTGFSSAWVFQFSRNFYIRSPFGVVGALKERFSTRLVPSWVSLDCVRPDDRLLAPTGHSSSLPFTLTVS